MGGSFNRCVSLESAQFSQLMPQPLNQARCVVEFSLHIFGLRLRHCFHSVPLFKQQGPDFRGEFHLTLAALKHRLCRIKAILNTVTPICQTRRSSPTGGIHSHDSGSESFSGDLCFCCGPKIFVATRRQKIACRHRYRTAPKNSKLHNPE